MLGFSDNDNKSFKQTAVSRTPMNADALPTPLFNNKPAAGNIPQTGDSSALAIEFAVLLMAAGALTVAIAAKKMRKGHDAR